MGTVTSTVVFAVCPWVVLLDSAVAQRNGSGAGRVKELIAEVVARREPEQLERTEAILDRFGTIGSGQEHRLYSAICHYYGEEPQADAIPLEPKLPAAGPRPSSQQKQWQGSSGGAVSSSSKAVASRGSSTLSSIFDLTEADVNRFANVGSESVEELRRNAHQLYDLVYGPVNAPAGSSDDIELWWRHRPSSRRTFVESYLGMALGRITHSQAKAQELNRAPLRDSVEELIVQKRQKAAVQEYTMQNRPWQRLEFEGDRWNHDDMCEAPLWRSRFAECRSFPSSEPCRKVIVDNFISESEAKRIKDMMARNYGELDRIGYRTLMAIDEKRRSMMGEDIYNLIGRVLERIQEETARSLNASKLYHHTSVLIRVDPEIVYDHNNYDPTFDSWGAHSDKANHGASDYIAALYLNTEGPDFEGGELVFHNRTGDLRVPMRTGRLVMYTGGMESVHSTLGFKGGTRHLISCSFTCNTEYATSGLGRYASLKLPASASKTLEQHLHTIGRLTAA